MELSRDYEMTDRSRLVAATVGAPMLAVAEIALVASIVELGLLVALGLGLGFATGWLAVAAAAIVYLIVLVGVLGVLVSTVDPDSFR